MTVTFFGRKYKNFTYSIDSDKNKSEAVKDFIIGNSTLSTNLEDKKKLKKNYR